jgi:hypothetical protein
MLCSSQERARIMKAYKAVGRNDADAVARGSVRLGTADEFRKLELDQLGRGDPNELARTARIAAGGEKLAGDHRLVVDTVFQYNGDERIFADMTIVGETVTQIKDAYLYCCSLAVDERRLVGDALFEIGDIAEFAARLARRSELNWRQFEQGPVTYREVVEAASAVEIAPVAPFEKNEAFAWQQEYRLMWAANPWERTLFIEAPELTELLKRIA